MSLPRLTLVVSLALALSVPAVAQADRPPTRSERLGIAKSMEIPKRCLRIRVSTVNERWSRASIRNLKASCADHVADGIAVFRHRRGAWRFVTAGSSFDCPVPDVPRRIAKDLKIPCEPRP
jgi:hypothetical protein